jgi:DNA-binding transcriptional regulator LsrR (DeoR family)
VGQASVKMSLCSIGTWIAIKDERDGPLRPAPLPTSEAAKEIAEQLGFPSKVSRLLKRAYQEGIVRAHHLPPMPRLATALIDQYALRDAVVIPAVKLSDVKEELGIATARYFEKIAGDGVKVGLSCGYTLYYMIKHLREGLIKDLKIYPLSAESTLRLVDLSPIHWWG